MCGIYLLFSKTLQPLHSLTKNLCKIQHRGQDSYGILYKNNENTLHNNFKGKIVSYEGDETTNLFIAHLRYTTSGFIGEDGSQPISSSNKFGNFSFVFNGNIPCTDYKFIFNREFTLDTTMIRHFLEVEAEKCDNWLDLLKKFINTFARAYSIIITTDTDVYMIKDRYGVRPLSYTISNEHQMFEICSETVGLSVYNDPKEVNAGSIVQINMRDFNAVEKYNFLKENNYNTHYGGVCIFEYIYFLNPNTTWDNLSVKKIREDWAITLAQIDVHNNAFNQKNEYIVIGIPSTGIQPGQSYAKYLNIEYKQAIIKNTNINRTFILTKEERDQASKKKYIYDTAMINGKKVIIIDDSIVRGITMKNIVFRLFECGATEVHIRIISPEIKDICMYGIDIPTKEELIATKKDNSSMNSFFGSNSLLFLNTEDMLKTIHTYIPKTKFCSGCFNGNYGEVKKDEQSFLSKLLSW